MHTLINSFESLKSKYHQALGKQDLLSKQLLEKQSELDKTIQLVALYNECSEVFKKLDNLVRLQTITKFENIMTRIYQYIFENTDSIVIVSEVKRNMLGISFFIKRGSLLLDPIEECGGGVVDVLQFSLRVASLLLLKPPMSKFIILDEPLKHLSENYRAKAVGLISQLSKEYGIQIIMTTHWIDFENMGGRVFEIGQDSNGISFIKNIRG